MENYEESLLARRPEFATTEDHTRSHTVAQFPQSLAPENNTVEVHRNVENAWA